MQGSTCVMFSSQLNSFSLSGMKYFFIISNQRIIPYQDTQETNKIVKKKLSALKNIGLGSFMTLLYFASQRFWQVSH